MAIVYSREALIEQQITVDTTTGGSGDKALDAHDRDVALTVQNNSIDLLVLTQQIWEK